MKEQDVAHSFDWITHEKAFKLSCPRPTIPPEKLVYQHAVMELKKADAELTRLRSELQTLQSALDHCKEVGSIRQDLIAEQKSELQQKDETVLELSEILVIAYDALSVVRTEPTMSGSVLASFDKNKFIKIRGDFFEFLDKHKTLESLIKKAKLNN